MGVFKVMIMLCNLLVISQSIVGFGEENDMETTELCNVDLGMVLPWPYNNMSNIVCKPVWNNYILRYNQREDNVVTIILSAVYTTGWVGIGFSKDGTMLGSSAMVGWINNKGHPKIKQYSLQGFTESQVIPDAGDLQLTQVPPTALLHQAKIYLAFQVKFQNKLGNQPILLAFSSKYPNNRLHLSGHDGKTSISFDFSESEGGSTSALPEKFAAKKKIHGIMGILGWGIILPIGAIVARYLKHKDPLWFNLHIAIQFIGSIFSFTAVLLGRQLYNEMHVHAPLHKAIGIFLLLLSILQVMAFFLRPNKDARIRKYWNWYHHWFGRIALFLGALNIVLGIKIANAGSVWKLGYVFVVIIQLVVVMVLEILLTKRISEKSTLPPTFQINPMQ